MLLILVIAAYLTIYCVVLVSPQSNSWSAHSPKPPEDLLRLWIDRQQVKMFSGKETRKKLFIYIQRTPRSRIVLRATISAHNLFSLCCGRAAPTHTQSRARYFRTLELQQRIFILSSPSSQMLFLKKKWNFLSTRRFLYGHLRHSRWADLALHFGPKIRRTSTNNTSRGIKIFHSKRKM